MADTAEFEVFKRHLRAAFPFNAMHINGHSEWSDTFFLDNHMHISRIFHLLRIHSPPMHKSTKGFDWPAIFSFFFPRFTPLHDAIALRWPCLWRRGTVATRVIWEALEDLILGYAGLIEKITEFQSQEAAFSTLNLTKTWLYNTLIEWYHPDLSSQDLQAKDTFLIGVLEEAGPRLLREIESKIQSQLPQVDCKDLVEFTITRIYGKALKSLFPLQTTTTITPSSPGPNNSHLPLISSSNNIATNSLFPYRTLTQPHIYEAVARLIRDTGVDFLFAKLYFRDLNLFPRYDFFSLKRRQSPCPAAPSIASSSLHHLHRTSFPLHNHQDQACFWESPKAIGMVWECCFWISQQICTGSISEAYQLTCKIFHISCSIFNQPNWYFDNLRAIKAFLHKQDCWVHLHPLHALFWYNLNGTRIYALIYYWIGGIDFCEDRLFFDEAEFCAIRGIQRFDWPPPSSTAASCAGLFSSKAPRSSLSKAAQRQEEEILICWTSGALPCNRVLVQKPEDPLETFARGMFLKQHLVFYGALGGLCLFCICFSVYIAAVVNNKI